MKTLKTYEKACDNLALEFLEALYQPDTIPHDYFWVGDESGGVLSFSDYFASMEDIAGYFRYGYTSKEYFEFYDQSLDKYGVNMKHYLKLKK